MLLQPIASEDVVVYIENSIKKAAPLRRAPKTLQTEIVGKLCSGAQGMLRTLLSYALTCRFNQLQFIWFDSILKEPIQIMKTLNEGRLRAALNKGPPRSEYHDPLCT
jgi:hypothetical protein